MLTLVLFAFSWELPTPRSPGLLAAVHFATSINAVTRMPGLEHELLLMSIDMKVYEGSVGWVSHKTRFDVYGWL